MTPEREAEIRARDQGGFSDGGIRDRRDLLTHIDHMRTWPGLMETIRSHFPEDVFDGSSGDPGPLLVVALRELDAAKAALDAERKAHAETREQLVVSARLLQEGVGPATARLLREGAGHVQQLEAELDAEKARADALEEKLAVLVDLSTSWRCAYQMRMQGEELAASMLAKLEAALADLNTTATAYRDRVRAEALEEAALMVEARRAQNGGTSPGAQMVRKEQSAVEERVRAMASEKGGAK